MIQAQSDLKYGVAPTVGTLRNEEDASEGDKNTPEGRRYYNYGAPTRNVDSVGGTPCSRGMALVGRRHREILQHHSGKNGGVGNPLD